MPQHNLLTGFLRQSGAFDDYGAPVRARAIRVVAESAASELATTRQGSQLSSVRYANAPFVHPQTPTGAPLDEMMTPNFSPSSAPTFICLQVGQLSIMASNSISAGCLMGPYQCLQEPKQSFAILRREHSQKVAFGAGNMWQAVGQYSPSSFCKL